MPGKRSQGGSEDPHGDAAAEKARAVAASRAAAKQYRDSLKVTAKRAASPPDDEGEVSRKKVKRQAGTTPSVSPSSPASMTKESRTLASRRRAKEYAKTLAATKKAAQALAEEEEQQQQQQEGEGEEEKEEGKRLPEAPRNDEQRGVPIADKMVEAFAGIQAPGPFEECKTTGAFGESTGAEATAGSREPEAFGGGEKAKGPVPMDIPAVVAWGELKPGVPDQLGTQQVSDQARPSSTTGEAVPLVPMPMSNRDDALVDGTSAEARQVAMPNLPPLPPVPPMPDVLPSVPRYHPPSDPAPRVSHPASYEGVTEGSFSRSSERREWGQPVRESRPQPAGRKSLRFEGIDSRYERASEPVAMTTRLRQRRVPVPRAEQEPSWPAGTTNPSVTETNGVGASNSTRPARMDGPAGVPPSRIRVRLLTLAPLIVPGFLWGALIPAWPRVKPTFAAVPRAVASVPSALTTAAKSILSSVPRLGPSSGRTEKCFLSSGEDASVCKAGSEPRECPAPATCGLGRILSCEFPYDIAVHGDGCTLTAAAVEEAGIVIKALSDRTIAEQCWGAGLVVPSKPRGGISLKDAARTVDRESLPLLAALQSGNVADLIELEGIPFSGFGSERIARLSKASLRRMKLPLGCRFRVWAVQKAMAYWKVIFGVIIVLGGGIWRDLARRRRYRQHVEVCSMRNDSYKALLDHAARESTPMQVGHIQDFVADRWRSGGEGRTASAKKLVLRLWPYVEREVEQDSRIRRSYKNVRGQQNVPCWEWLAPSTSFDTIGALDPGSPPLMWLLPNKKR